MTRPPSSGEIADGLREVAYAVRAASPLSRPVNDCACEILHRVADAIGSRRVAVPAPARALILAALRGWTAQLDETGTLAEPERTAGNLEQLASLLLEMNP